MNYNYRHILDRFYNLFRSLPKSEIKKLENLYPHIDPQEAANLLNSVLNNIPIGMITAEENRNRDVVSIIDGERRAAILYQIFSDIDKDVVMTIMRSVRFSLKFNKFIVINTDEERADPTNIYLSTIGSSYKTMMLCEEIQKNENNKFGNNVETYIENIREANTKFHNTNYVLCLIEFETEEADSKCQQYMNLVNLLNTDL